MSEDFTPEENAEFIRLLKKVQHNDYWVPTLETWQEVQRTFSRWAIELVIIDQSQEKPRILLSRYKQGGVPEHQGLFHINGGFEKFSESIQESASRIAKDELDIEVKCRDVVDVHKWTALEHPWGSRLLSLYILCEPLGEIKTSDETRYFTRDEMLALGPKDMALNHPHRIFADTYLRQLGSV